MRTFAKLALVLVLAGCGASLKTAPVKGQVEFTDGEIAELAESHVELEADDDPTLRGSGVITSDGRFTIQTLHKGQVILGLPKGSYKARLVLSDETPAAKKKNAVVHKRFLDFKTSGLAVTVPSTETITLTVARR